jgi:hypothetical protein
MTAIAPADRAAACRLVGSPFRDTLSSLDRCSTRLASAATPARQLPGRNPGQASRPRPASCSVRRSNQPRQPAR